MNYEGEVNCLYANRLRATLKLTTIMGVTILFTLLIYTQLPIGPNLVNAKNNQTENMM